jgi:hypothetical protein
MKTIKIVLAAIIISFSTMSFASTNVPAGEFSINKDRISEIVKSQISFPESIVSQNAMVAVSFTFNNDDELVITNMNYSDEAFKSYVSSQLSKISIHNAHQYIGNEFNMQILFQSK